MRTTIDIPEELIREAMTIAKYRTKTELIKRALNDIIRKHKIQDLKEYRGKLDLETDLNTIRDRDEYPG